MFESFEKYGEFLSSDAHIRGKLFAAENGFQEHIKKTLPDAPLGPYFQRALRELKSGNPEIIDFIGNIFNPRHLDRVYLQLKEDVYLFGSKPLSKFQEVTEEILNIAFDTQDTSKLRKFILRFPRAAFESTLYIDDSYIHSVNIPNLIDDYDPNFQYERLKQLVESVEEENFSFLNEYMYITTPDLSSKIGEVLDKEILRGEVDRAQSISNFWKQVHEGFSINNVVDVTGIEAFWVFYTEQFIDNQITEEQLSEIASSFKDLRFAISSLSNYSEDSADTIFDRDDNGRYDALELVKDPDFLRDGRTIARLVSAGIYPQKGIREQLVGNEEELKEIVQFGHSLISSRKEDDFFNKNYQDIIEDWIFKYLDSLSDKKFSLQDVAKNLKSVRGAMLRFYESINASDRFKDCVESFIKNLCSSEVMVGEEASFVELLFNHAILPTENVMQYMKDNGEVGIDNLITMRDETAKGRFDPQNNVQKDLEFVKYLSLMDRGISSEAYDQFKSIKLLEEKTKTHPVLDAREQMETEAAAFEAANLFHFIKERKDLGRKVSVIGNQRYGAYFVVEPLRYYLERNGIPVSIYYVRSGQNTEAYLTRTFNVIKAYLDRNDFDDIIVVDGTRRPFSGDIPRLPNALAIYGERLAQDGYSIAHWTSVKGEEIMVGDRKEEYSLPSDQKPQVILANPVIDSKRFADFPGHLSNHIPGYLDDSERFGFKKSEVVLTKNGIEALQFGRTEQEFIELVQNHMGYVMDYVIGRIDGKK